MLAYSIIDWGLHSPQLSIQASKFSSHCVVVIPRINYANRFGRANCAI